MRGRPGRPAVMAVDILRETPDGLVVWQVKRFTAPLTPGQRKQVRSSWKRFWETHVTAGTRIVEYHLATPWTPTDNQLAWFRNELTAGADFPVIWDGEAFFNALAADFPATAGRFFKGPDMLEAMVNAKAVLASSPVEAADEVGFQDALAKREDALRELRDMVSDHYYIDVGTRTSSSDTEPPIDHDSPAVMHRYLHLGGGRWSIESIVPKTAQATIIDPINLNVRFLVEPDTDDEQTFEEWRLWGVPFDGLPAQTRQSGGPLGEGEESEGLLSFRRPPLEPGLPGLTLNTSGPGDEPGSLVTFAVRELTRGHEGGGVRVVAATGTGILELEARIASTEAEPSLVLRLGDCEGAGPGDVLRDLEEISTIADHETISISIENGPVVFVASALGAPPIADYVAAVARALAALQSHTSEVLRMPDIREVTDTQLAHAERLAAIYSGDAYTSTWDRLVLTVGPDSEGFRQPNMFTGVGALVQTESPEFWLGSSSYTVTRLLATQYLTPTIRDLAVLDELSEGDELEVRAGDDNRVVVAAVVDE